MSQRSLKISHTNNLIQQNNHTPTHTNCLSKAPQTQQMPTANKPSKSRRTRQQHIPTITAEDPNLWIGDNLIIPKPPQTLRIYCQNIRGAKHKYDPWDDWIDGHNTLSEWEVDVATLNETNTQWNHTNITAAKKIAKSQHNQLRTNMTGSNELTDTDYQPGGAYCSIHGKWTGRIINRITDSTGLGRWTGFRIEGKHKKNIIVLSAYRPTKSSDYGDNTCYSQQWRILRNTSTQQDPKPRQQFITDLIKLVKKWQEEQSEIIIGMDANDPIDTPNSDIIKLLQDTTLTTLHKDIEAPATYARGKNCIDFIFGTPQIANATKAKGFIPFLNGAWVSDHRALFVDIDTLALFNGDTSNLENPNTRNLNSNNNIQSTKFLEHLAKSNTLPDLANQLFQLNNKNDWTPTEHQELEQIDKEFTKLLLRAEQRCINRNATPWSPEVHEAYTIKKYWKTTVSSQRTRKSARTQLAFLLTKLKDPSKVWQGNADLPASHQLNKAIKKLREIKQNATQLRQDYLIRQQKRYLENNDKKRAAILQTIQKVEQKKRCFRIIKSYNKPIGETGGLSHILIEQNNDTVRIHQKDELEHHLFERNRVHFAQAHCTPCATGELAELLGYSGISPFSKKILDGDTLQNHLNQPFPQTTEALLAELKQKRTTQSPHIPLAHMIEGFQKWRETTTTSPSGKHLGIYRTLTKMYRSTPPVTKPISHQPQPTTKATNDTNNKTPNTTHQEHYRAALQALQIQNLLLNLAILHTHTYERWLVIHNFFLEKLPGRPLIEKLRVIHLYEADWNLILKYFIAYKLNLITCREQTVAPEQAGGRPGKNAADTAAATVITNEIIMLQKLPGTILYHDAKACFDRIIENLSNATLMSEGINPRLVLHAQTLAKAKYHIKTKYGVAARPNGHMQPDAFHGTGQGAADSMPRWGFLSDTAIKAYNKLATSEPITSPFQGTMMLTTKIRAFVDDTNCPTITHKNDLEDLKATLIHNAKLWETLLFTIGGKLELSKCKFLSFLWTTDDNGTVKLQDIAQIGSIAINSSESQTPCEITEIKPTEPYKLLGIQMTLNGNSKAQESALREKCNKMTKVFTLAPLKPNDVATGYRAVILPTIKYRLAATNIPWYKLDKMEKPLIHTILPKMGINRHLPRAIVFAPEHFGGLGIQQLSAEQGLAHIQFLAGSWQH